MERCGDRPHPDPSWPHCHRPVAAIKTCACAVCFQHRGGGDTESRVRPQPSLVIALLAWFRTDFLQPLRATGGSCSKYRSIVPLPHPWTHAEARALPATRHGIDKSQCAHLRRQRHLRRPRISNGATRTRTTKNIDQRSRLVRVISRPGRSFPFRTMTLKMAQPSANRALSASHLVSTVSVRSIPVR